MKKTAIILGASGLTGSILLEKLILDNRYEKIKLFSRKKIENQPEKVIQYIGNIIELEQFKEVFTGDEVFCCIGTTTKKTPNKSIYKSIDYGIPAKAAQLAKKNNITTFVVISALGANPKSSICYNRTKGEMEKEVQQQNIKKTYILQPSIIGGNRKENRTGEKMALAVFKLLNPLFIGKLKKYKIINASDIAQTMLNLANSDEISQTLTSDKIKEFSKIYN